MRFEQIQNHDLKFFKIRYANKKYKNMFWIKMKITFLHFSKMKMKQNLRNKCIQLSIQNKKETNVNNKSNYMENRFFTKLLITKRVKLLIT